LSAFFDSPQTASLMSLLILVGIYVAYIAGELTTAAANVQAAACIIPPLALQIAAGSFKKSYQGLPLPNICGIMVSLHFGLYFLDHCNIGDSFHLCNHYFR
jgi:hypothetical protein